MSDLFDDVFALLNPERLLRDPRATALQVLFYSVGLTGLTVIPACIGTFGTFYLGAAVMLGLVLCALSWRMWRTTTPANAGILFHYSLLYLALLFVAVAVDAAMR